MAANNSRGTAPTSYGLAPMQAGMLFESLRARGDDARGGGVDVEQLHVSLAEAIDAGRLAQAFTRVVRRHDALASAFQWEGGPRQSVTAGVIVPVVGVDWRLLSVDARAERLRSFLESDRARGFDPSQAPLVRAAVFTTGAETSEVVWTFHHLLLDGRSIPQVFTEVFAAYDAISRDESPRSESPARPYRAYVEWTEQLDRTASLDYFRALLAGKSTSTPLPLAEPAARPLPARGTGEVRLVLPARVAAAARELARRTGATTGTLVHAAWALVLARTTGEPDVVFGTTRSTRRGPNGAAPDDTVGLFINTVPLRVVVDDDQTVRALVGSVREVALALREHVHAPLVDVHGVSAVPRGSPLFETLLMFDNRELGGMLRASGDPRWATARAELLEQPSTPLTVLAFDTANAFDLRVLFDRSRYREAVARRLVQYLARAIEELAADEDRRVGDLDVLPPDERQRVLRDWNDTARPFERARIQDGFEARAHATPDAVAVEFEHETLSYAELDARANRLAHELLARGAVPGRYVGICLRRGLELVVALLAAAKAGCPYVPLDPEYPPARIAFMVKDSGAPLVVTERFCRGLFTGAVVVVDGVDAGAIAAQPTGAPPCPSTPEDDCYAIFTSGSTGTPKGVVLTHAAVVNTFDWVTRTLGVGPGDRLLFVTSPCFDLSVYDTFGALAAGATVVVASNALLEDPEALARALVERRITIWDSAPAAFQRLVPFLPAESTKAPLRLVMWSGDWIPIGLPDAARGAFPGAEVVSLGGATEAAIWSNWFPVGALDPRWTSVPYGRPIQNARYHVLDAAMRPVPVGTTGDLYIGGTCLARGYLNRPELTRERFVRDPFADSPDERLYKTGDLARYFDDGELEFLGRADFQVKIRGYRVELGEVEAALAQLPGVKDAVCAARPDPSGQKSLVAYVVARDGVTLDADDVRDQLASRLTDFMVPSQIVFLEALPLSSNGKVDRKALPDPTTVGRAQTVPPRDDRERALVSLWRSLLGVDEIGVTDDFFALGGHSLLAVTLVTRMESELGVKVRLASVLERPTIEKLARHIDETCGTRTVPPAPHSHATTLVRGGPRPPMVLVSGSGGFGFVFRGMARFLAGQHDVHVLHAVGADDEREGLDHSIEEMAAIYARELDELAPHGPILLGGYSFGILVAFELAARLRAQGRKVPLLVSFDGFGPRYPEILPFRERVMEHARAIFLDADPEQRRAYIRERLHNVRLRFDRLLGREPVSANETERRLHRLEEALWRARGAYNPGHVFPSDLLLLKTSISAKWPGAHMDDPVHGWRRYVGGNIDVVTVPGDHHTLFTDANQRLLADTVLRATSSLRLAS